MKRSAYIVRAGWQISTCLTVAGVAVSYYAYQLVRNWAHTDPPPFFTFFPMMMLTTIILGRWQGLLYTTLSVLVVEYWIFQPQDNIRTVSLLDVLALGLYFAYCLIMIFLVEFSRRHIARGYQLEAMRTHYEVSQKFEAALSSMTDAVVITDAEGNFINYNDAFATLLGYSSKSQCPKSLPELQALLEIFDINGEPLMPEKSAIATALAGEIGTNVERRVRRRDTGEEWTASFNFSPIRDEHDKIAGSVIVVRDVTNEKRTIEALEASYEFYRAAFHVSQNGLVLTRAADGLIQDMNDRFTEMLGYTKEEVIGKTTQEIFAWQDPQDRERVIKMLREVSPYLDLDLKLRSKNGELIQATVAFTKFKLNSEECLLTDIRDVTPSKRAEEEIKKLGELAYYDPLTGLANRRMFIDRLVHCLQRSERSNQFNGLVYMDLNHFKELNDRHGHANGDHVLCGYAQRLLRVVRKGDTVARIGGDEFVILLENLGTSMEQAIESIGRVVSKLEKLSEEPMRLPKLEWICTSSIGVKLFTGNMMSAEQLVEAADVAMYKNKIEERQAQ